MTYLLWVRTSRSTATLTDEIDELRRSLIQYSNVAHDWVQPFISADQVLFGIDSNTNIHAIKSLISPTLKRDYFVDWSLTDVGTGVGPADQYWGEYDGDEIEYDERFITRHGQDSGYYDDETDDADISKTEAAELAGFTRLRWRLNYDVKGATALWVDLGRERLERDRTIRAIEQLLPRPFRHLWHGRSSLTFGYSAQHDPRGPVPFGISPRLKDLLDGDEISYFLAFQVGSWSVGGVAENLNQMADFIWSQGSSVRTATRGDRARRPAIHSPEQQSKFVSIVLKRSRPPIRKPGPNSH